MEMFFLCGIAIGFLIGYPLGLFIDKLDKREKDKNGGR
jgi:NhaP-type Na+/H+ or K+/H+ antiporter